MKYIIFAIFFLTAFANTSIFGHLYLVEIPVIIGMFMLLSNRDIKALSFNRIDRLIVVYAVFSFISVAVGIDSFYESARHYRLTVLTPVLIYLIIRFGSSSIQQLQKAMFFIIPGTLWQGILLIQYYVMHGERPVGIEGVVSTISMGALMAISLFIMLFNFKEKPKGMMGLLRYGLIGVLFIMLIVTGTRAALIGFIVLTLAIIVAWKYKSRRIWIGRSMMAAISILLVLIISGSIILSSIQVEDLREKQASVERVFDVELLLSDLSGRIAFWGKITNVALESPIFGSGAASHEIGKSGGTLFHLGSAHNVLVSSLITSGVPGLAILIALIAAFYRIFKIIDDKLMRDCVLGKTLIGSVTVLIMIAITNDFSGGRIFIWFLMLAIGARLLNELPRTSIENNDVGKKEDEKVFTNKLSVLHLKS